MSRATMILGVLNLLGAFAAGQEAVSLAVTPPASVVSANEPIVIQLSVANKGRGLFQAAIDGQFNEEFVVSLVGNGTKQTLQWNPYSDPDSGRFGGNVKLRHGEGYSKRLALNEWFRQLAPGTYRFEIGLRGRSIEPASFHIKVLARNAASMRKICSELAEEILSSSFEEGLPLAHVLGYAIDPEAVPFMQEVVEKQPDYAWPLVKGLIAIGDRRAIAALGTLMIRASTEAARSTARGNLVLLRHSTKDEAIRREIDAILQAQ
jgi:hypothetical protein